MTVSSLHRDARSIRRHLLAGSVVAALFILGIAGWARTAELAGAVITSGVVVVDSDVKKVQHPTGGVVGDYGGRYRSAEQRQERL